MLEHQLLYQIARCIVVIDDHGTIRHMNWL